MREFLRNSILPCVALVAIAMLFYPVVRHTAPSGEIIPESEPEPYRRIDTGLGASIVRPESWDETEATQLARYVDREHFDTHVIKPIQYLRRRGGAGIFVRRCKQKPEFDAELFSKTMFNELPAWHGLYVDSTNAIDYIPTYCVHIARGGEWWTVGFWTTSKMDELPEGPRRFLESVEFDTPIEESDNNRMHDGSASQGQRSG